MSAANSDDREARLRERGVVRELSSAEFAALVEGAEPRTDDDVPWRFRVRDAAE